MSQLDNRTIKNFGDQWQIYQGMDGFFGSLELLKDMIEPLIQINDIENKIVLEIGSGNGRIVKMLLNAGAKKVIAIEPSDSFHVLINNLSRFKNKIEAYKVSGENLPNIKADVVLSIGVLHHIEDPKPVVKRAFEILNKGGKFLFWVYGLEGNETYLLFLNNLRKVTKKLPDFLLIITSHILTFFTYPYIFLCKIFNLPLKGFMLTVMSKLDWKWKAFNIFDQLNPSYAKYYSKHEALNLMKSGGFNNIKIHNRHGYSWTVLGEKN